MQNSKDKTKFTIICNRVVELLLFSSLILFSGCGSGEVVCVPEIVSFGIDQKGPEIVNERILKVMTLNLGHGKGRGMLQEFVSNKKTLENLEKVAEILLREKLYVVALQEGDIKSHRSGNFNHVNYIAEQAGYLLAIHGEHAKGLGFYHGTALISNLGISDPLSVKFNSLHSLSDKGFVVGTVVFGPNQDKVDVVSVHLSVTSESARKKQVYEMVAHLSARKNPLVIMGDFNCQLRDSKEIYSILNSALSLRAYELNSENLATLSLFSRRIDWILISPELKFCSYAVLDERVSDHFAIIAELTLAAECE